MKQPTVGACPCYGRDCPREATPGTVVSLELPGITVDVPLCDQCALLIGAALVPTPRWAIDLSSRTLGRLVRESGHSDPQKPDPPPDGGG